MAIKYPERIAWELVDMQTNKTTLWETKELAETVANILGGKEGIDYKINMVINPTKYVRNEIPIEWDYDNHPYRE